MLLMMSSLDNVVVQHRWMHVCFVFFVGFCCVCGVGVVCGGDACIGLHGCVHECGSLLEVNFAFLSEVVG